MADPIPFGLKTIWNDWNIRACVMFSLFLQVFLTLSAPSRKRTANKIVNLLIWLAYLLADSTATFAIGLIANIQESRTPSSSPDNNNLLAFWGPFLLLHLGGPDTITAFALEDNELWPRHLLQLIVQMGATIYVFTLTLDKTKLINPSFLIFLDGVIKYLERTCSLYLASTNRIRATNTTTQILAASRMTRKLNDVQVVQEAYVLYQQFKGVIVDRKFKFNDLSESRAFFNSIDAKDALRVVETELNFMCEVLFTKAAVMHSKLGYLFRLISFSSAVSALAIFHFKVGKQGFNEFDIGITYALLFGAVGLDIIAFFMAIFSDWTVVNALKIISAGPLLSKSILHRKWSGSVSGRSLRMRNFMNIGYVMKNYCHFMSFKGYVKGGIYLCRKSLDEDYWEFIFTEMKLRSQWAYNSKKAEEIYSGNGKWLQSSSPELGIIISELGLNEIGFDESILLWHVVTEYFYSDHSSIYHHGKERNFSKFLSYYMFYLLLDEPSIVVAASGICKLRFSDSFKDTLDKLRKDFLRPVGRLYLKYFDRSSTSTYVSHLPSLCSALISTLSKMENGMRWKLISKMWVELLAFAASHCKGNVHAQYLSKGGELVTIVWLLMNHFSLGGLQD